MFYLPQRNCTFDGVSIHSTVVILSNKPCDGHVQARLFMHNNPLYARIFLIHMHVAGGIASKTFIYIIGRALDIQIFLLKLQSVEQNKVHS